MSEKQCQQAAATKMDPLIQFIFQQARQDIMSRNLPEQVNIRQQLQEQHQELTPEELQSLITKQRALRRTDESPSSLAMLATQPLLKDQNTAAATVSTSSSQAGPAANIALRPKHKCANCGGHEKPCSASHVAGADE
jgi:cation transport regulator ChaB